MQQGFEPSTIKELIKYSLKGTVSADAWHVTRTSMYKSLRGRFAASDGADKNCLAISDSAWFGKILGLSKCRYVSANYPEHNILKLAFPSDHFDFVVSDQVFEHIEGNPFTAFNETVRILKPGGLVCHTTCFINPIHAVPKDFWRFTPDALALMAKDAGCVDVQSEGWGNREAWALISAGFRMDRIPVDEEHPLYRLAMRNEPDWPIVTWVVARKPLASESNRA